MNAKQKNQVVKILKRDCQIAGRYIGQDGTCAIGALALKAGVSRRFLRKQNSYTIGGLPWVVGKIERTFGLDLAHLRVIQCENDFHDSPGYRRKAVVAVVKGFDIQ